MKKNILLIMIFVFAAVFSACNTQGEKNMDSDISKASKQDFIKISAQLAKEIMEEKDVVVLDVRRKDEYDVGHIENAILLPNEEIGTQMPEALPNLDAEILVYCRSGVRSEQAAQKLVDIGYTNVKDFGGIIDWDYKTVTD